MYLCLETRVGRAARPHLVNDPFHTIFNAKRFIGRKFSDPVVQQEEGVYDFNVVPNSTNSDDAFTCFELQLRGHPPCASPVQVGSLVVEQLRQAAIRFLQHDQVC